MAAKKAEAAPKTPPHKPKKPAAEQVAHVKAHAVAPPPEVTVEDLLAEAKTLGDKIRAFDLSDVETRTRFGLIAIESAENELTHPTGPV